YRKHQCMHCNEPCCASVCFVDAFTKTPEGPVLYDPELCVGCRYCVFACPYNALAYEYEDPLTPRVVRCTMCYPRIKKGLNPACADACPTGAIVYGKRKDLIRLADERIRKYPERYINHIFGEHEWGGTSWLTLAGIPLKEMDLPQNAGPEPLPNLTTGFLSLAPIVAALFPGLLAGVYAFSKRTDNLNQAEKDSLLNEAKATADQQLKDELAAAEHKAQRDQEYAISLAVKDALREAKKAESVADGPSKEEPK
ncbi:MAG: 4Fe-4S binding protein, partial [Deltaproteobacteria bacterium]|nr:4Fe-4S binding protein [Deltaproteobacteria bacterium]